jgi:regulator of replication initiation timing
MQEEYWAAQNEIIWEKQFAEQSCQITTLSNQNTTLSNQNTTLSNQNTTLSNQNTELRRLLQQAGIEIPKT